MNSTKKDVKDVNINVFNLIYESEKILYIGKEEKIDVTNNVAFQDVKNDVISSLKSELEKIERQNNVLESKLEIYELSLENWKKIKDIDTKQKNLYEVFDTHDTDVISIQNLDNPFELVKIDLRSIRTDNEKNFYAYYHNKLEEYIYDIFDIDNDENIVTTKFIEYIEYFQAAKSESIKKLESKIKNLRQDLEKLNKTIKINIESCIKIWEKFPQQEEDSDE